MKEHAFSNVKGRMAVSIPEGEMGLAAFEVLYIADRAAFKQCPKRQINPVRGE